MVEGLHQAVFSVARRDIIGDCLHALRGIAHGNAQTGMTKHFQVIPIVSHGHNVFRRNAFLSRKLL